MNYPKITERTPLGLSREAFRPCSFILCVSVPTCRFVSTRLVYAFTTNATRQHLRPIKIRIEGMYIQRTYILSTHAVAQTKATKPQLETPRYFAVSQFLDDEDTQ